MAGGKGGKTTTQTVEQKIDPALQKAASAMLPVAFDIASIGGIGMNPYQGPTIAAPNQGMRDAMNATMQGGNAFGLGFSDPTANLPQAKDYGGGMVGYSPYELSQQQIQGMSPGTRQAIEGLFGPSGLFARRGTRGGGESRRKRNGIGGKGGGGGLVEAMRTGTHYQPRGK